MRLVVVANARIPSEKAHPLQIMQMAGAFAETVSDVRLVYARRDNTDAMRVVRDPFDYFGVARRFALVGLPCFDLVKRVTVDWPALSRTPFPLLAHYLQLWSFSVAALFLAARMRADVVYGRDVLPLTLLRMFTRHPSIYCFEAHTTPMSRLSRRLHMWAVRRFDRVVVITEGLRRWYLDRGLAPDRVLLAPDGVDLAAFDGLSRESARAELGIPDDAPVVCYLGHLFPWKGVDTLVAAVPQVDPRARVFIVGGVSPDLDRIRERARGLPTVTVTGYLPPDRARRYVAACDIAVIPFTARAPITRSHASPLKLFEYMAAGAAIVAGDLPSLREVLEHERNAVLVPPDDPAALASGINRVLHDRALAERIGRTALAEVNAFTWTRRAKSIIAFLSRPPTA